MAASDLSKLSSLNVDVVDFNVKSSSLPEQYHLIVVEDTGFDVALLAKVSAALGPRGFALLAESTSVAIALSPTTLKSLGLQSVAVVKNETIKYFLLKKVITKWY